MDEFSDDGLDGLNESVLQELENNAIRSTQAHAAAPQPQDNVLGYEFEDDDLDDTIVIDEQAPQPPRPPSVKTAVPVPQPRHVAGLAGTQRWNQPLLPPRPTYPSRTQYPAPRRPVPQPPPSQRYPSLPSGRAQPPPPRSQFVRPYSHQPSQALHATGPAKQNEIIAALQARLSELESDLTAAKGEAAILRSKYEKAQATHDAEVTRLKKQSAEQLAKQERAIEAARTAERTASTELEFARQELREGLGRAKSKRKDGPATPKKNKTWGMADGFDGVEILSSPSNKGQGLRRKDSGATALPPPERTPSKGKRKRPIVDSPTFALETDSGDAVFDGLHAASAPSGPPWRAHNPLPFDFLRLVLDHSAVHGQSPTFDLFSRFAFPSDPGQSFASIIFQKLPQMGNPREPLRLLSDFADLVIDMWQRCLSEKYHAPIFYLAALVLYTLDLNVVAVAPHIISSLVPVCATTCCLVALPRFNSIDGDMSAHPDTVVRQLCLDIDVTQCLAVLYLAALGCLSAPLEESDASDAPRPSPQTQFWKTMDLDFVLMMLNPKHPEADWFCMVSLVGTSVARDSIGPVSSPATNSSGCPAERRDPKVVAATLIECVSWYLCHSTKWAPSGSTKEIVVRLAALRTLVMFATSPFGALQMAGSDFAIPRLVTVLCWAIDMLYDMDVTPPRPRKAGQRQTDLDESTTEKGDNMDLDDDLNGARDMRPDGEGQRQPNDGVESEREAAAVQETVDPDPASVLCRLISQATQLLHFLVTDSRTADVANTATKLAASHGGSQRYLLTLARLNFAEEDLVLEAGIDAETMELAHELLELAVTPDEGDEIGDMFGV